MKHLGDITKINGAEIPIVDCITGGSPCQDLSIAGARAGLSGERSGLFMEQIRVVKEMREHDRATGRTGWAVRPRYMVWENVPGALSSGKPKGADFQIVLTEIVKIAEPDAPDVPMPVQGGWTKSGCLYSEVGQWSVAWRVHDAQFWGVPQRRKRIAVVADFGGLTAPEILFEQQGLHGHLAAGRETGEETAGGIEDSSDGTGEQDQAICLQGNGIDRADNAGCNGAGWRRGGCYTLNTIDRPAVYAQDQGGRDGGGKGPLVQTDKSATLSTLQDQTLFQPIGFKQGNGAKAGGVGVGRDISPTLAAADSGTNQVPAVVCGNPWDSQSERVYQGDGAWHSLNSNSGGQSRDAICTAVDCRNGTENADVNGTLQAKANGGTSLNTNNVVRTSYGFEPGAAKRLNTEGRFTKETAPTLRENPGDNRGG